MQIVSGPVVILDGHDSCLKFRELFPGAREHGLLRLELLPGNKVKPVQRALCGRAQILFEIAAQLSHSRRYCGRQTSGKLIE